MKWIKRLIVIMLIVVALPFLLYFSVFFLVGSGWMMLRTARVGMEWSAVPAIQAPCANFMGRWGDSITPFYMVKYISDTAPGDQTGPHIKNIIRLSHADAGSDDYLVTYIVMNILDDRTGEHGRTQLVKLLEELTGEKFGTDGEVKKVRRWWTERVRNKDLSKTGGP